MTYDLGIKTHQDLLLLNPSLIPLEGFLRLKSSQQLPDSMTILINGSPAVSPGGLGSEMIVSDDLIKLKQVPLNPGKYTIDFKVGNIEKSMDIVIESKIEKSVIIELVTEKNRTKEIIIKEE